ncbi:hypothetical protein DCC85_13715 [Paenibacillus sp. CAA11]|uniref:helicase-associated domain-containing protein n=1 Tax=Paenibacillus sp. CAA11 TaxID=1532905 RepID=UPI000D3C4CFE|nr:helicase-associated domain-containing protein [Paenibacillus sp. CAA11]AWB45179.1 hypothetical protein DCC85_13715 [Paenibacillus sp. CAA11]
MNGKSQRPWAVLTLNRIYQRFAFEPFFLEQLEETADSGLSGAELRAGLYLLERQGQVSVVSKDYEEKRYCLPFMTFLEIKQSRPLPGIVPLEDQEVSLRTESRPGLALDIFRALSFIAKGGLPLTSKGGIRQKAIQQLRKEIVLSDEDLLEFAQDPLNIKLPSSPAEMILYLANTLGLAGRGPLQWQVLPAGLEAWLRCSWTEMEEQLLVKMLFVYPPADTKLRHLAAAILAPNIQEGAWYEVESFIHRLEKELGPCGAVRAAHKHWLHGWLRMLCGCGWLALGLTGEGGQAFRWIRKPKPSADLVPAVLDGRFYIQPDFEILIPPDVAWSVRWELEIVTEYVHFDNMTTYRLTREALQEAIICYGRTATEIMAFLKKHAAAQLPVNVELSIMEWAKEADAECNCTHGGHQVPTFSGIEQQKSEGLQSLKISSRPSREDVIAAESNGWKEELFPGIRNVPLSWTKELRGYHTSTARELLRQAMEWKTKVRFKLGESCPSIGRPTLLLTDGAEWKVQVLLDSEEKLDVASLQVAEWAPSEWEALQILLPEI